MCLVENYEAKNMGTNTDTSMDMDREWTRKICKM